MANTKVIAVVGMNGSGKSEVARVFEKGGFTRIRFGDLTDKEVERRGFVLNEENERKVREQLRQEHGMAAYAKLNIPIIDEALGRSHVVVDGLYSWEEYKLLKERYGSRFLVVAVYSSPKTRQGRVSQREVRPLSPGESLNRDFGEIENLNKAGPIAMADFALVNESSLEDLRKEAESVMRRITTVN